MKPSQRMLALVLVFGGLSACGGDSLLIDQLTARIVSAEGGHHVEGSLRLLEPENCVINYETCGPTPLSVQVSVYEARGDDADSDPAIIRGPVSAPVTRTSTIGIFEFTADIAPALTEDVYPVSVGLFGNDGQVSGSVGFELEAPPVQE